MGSGDHHMALGMVGAASRSLPGGVGAGYRDAVTSWAIARGRGNQRQARLRPRHDRAPVPRPQERPRLPVRAGRCSSTPASTRTTDLKRNACGVLEFAGNKPDLERAFDRYLRSREEDVNTLT